MPPTLPLSEAESVLSICPFSLHKKCADALQFVPNRIEAKCRCLLASPQIFPSAYGWCGDRATATETRRQSMRFNRRRHKPFISRRHRDRQKSRRAPAARRVSFERLETRAMLTMLSMWVQDPFPYEVLGAAATQG